MPAFLWQADFSHVFKRQAPLSEEKHITYTSKKMKYQHPTYMMKFFGYAHKSLGLTFTAFPEDLVKASHRALPTFTSVSFHCGELVGQKMIKSLWRINNAFQDEH